MNLVPTTYSEWRECIEVRCQIKITSAFCQERLKDLKEGSSHYASQFKKMYGDQHLSQVVSWFEQAAKELG
ncbi:MAG: hypothetical protein HRU19_06885 [Pseudobacteriovorax sp.]|nr:hypothetical protein [Pseudobacteriovorax sp.]